MTEKLAQISAVAPHVRMNRIYKWSLMPHYVEYVDFVMTDITSDSISKSDSICKGIASHCNQMQWLLVGGQITRP